MRALFGCFAIMLAAALFLAGAALAPAAAETTFNCRAFGTNPFCSGRCPSGWTQMYRIGCVTGSKAYCCQNKPAVNNRWKCRAPAAGYNPNRQVNGMCQRCVAWDRRRDCVPKGAMTGACTKFVWERCAPPIRLN